MRKTGDACVLKELFDYGPVRYSKLCKMSKLCKNLYTMMITPNVPLKEVNNTNFRYSLEKYITQPILNEINRKNVSSSYKEALNKIYGVSGKNNRLTQETQT